MERKAAFISMPVLGIESSCDETAAAVLAPDGTILAELVLSQIADHAAFGGVVPEIAARAHLSALSALVAQVLETAKLGFAELGAIAATAGPGLIGGLLVGTGFAKGAAIAAQKPYLAINHLEAHALTARLPGLSATQPSFPYLLLLLSGGHSQCVVGRGRGKLPPARHDAWTTRSARPSIKPPNSSACPIPAARRWKLWRDTAMPKPLPCPARCCTARAAISPSPA